MRIVRLTFRVLIVLVNSVIAAHAGVTPVMQKAIRAATFEVVRKKPERDPLEYEKPLPFELLPYTERTDAYESIGTAFALGDNTYVTAAHVLVAGVNSQYGPPSLRASDGTVYSIDQIRKFSDFRDFAIFSLAKDPKPIGFEINRTPQVDDAVLAVGNALGDGIVIRDGLFTSETAEDQDGRWKWIRFSAAASPGNSGGPLLDVTGKVIGIVIGKSPNENLNYSLPIREALDAPDGKATFDERLVTRFFILRNTHTYTYKQEFKLPLSWAEFSRSYEQVIVQHSEQARAALLGAYDSKIFPKGSGTESLLFDLDPGFEVRIITQQADDTWAAASPGSSTADLPGDGYVTVTQNAGGGLSLVRLHRSDDATDDAFYNNSKAFMDLALKGLNVTRAVGQDNVRVTSLGAALSDTLYTDRYGRKWQQRVWPLPYLDAYIIGMLLPTPDGYAALLQYVPSSLLRFAKTQTNQLVDYVDISYSGTLAQWQAYLKRRTLLPVGFGDIKLESGKDLALRTRRFVFSVPAVVMPVDQHSDLEIAMGFMRDGERVVWDAGGARLYRDTQRKSWVELARQKQPPPTAKVDLRNKFGNMQNRRSPYDMQSSREQDDTFAVSGTLDAPGVTAGKISPDLVYGVTLALEGSPAKTDLVTKQNVLLTSMQVLERGDAPEIKPIRNDSYNEQEKAKARSLEWIKSTQKQAEELSAELGKDSRGRTYAQDTREFVTGPMEKLVTDMTEPNPVTYEQWRAAMARGKALDNYWRKIARLTNNREIWTAFLQANQLNATTQHNAEIQAQEAKLAALLAGEPSTAWAEQVVALSDAYLNERRQILKDSPGDVSATFVPRTSACPPVSRKTSGKDEPGMDPDSPGMPEDYYPAASKRKEQEGCVMLQVQINEQGCATGVRVAGHSGYAALDAAALSTYERMQFLPAERSGKAIASTKKFIVTFKLND